VLGVAFALVVFVILWAMFFAGWIQDVANRAIVDMGLTGLEAALLAYINLWIFCGVILGTLTFLYFGGGTQ
jgi:hypothetical protein